MSDPLLPNTGCGEDIVPTLPTSNHCHMLQLPTELLLEIVVALNKDYLKESLHTDDSLRALRL